MKHVNENTLAAAYVAPAVEVIEVEVERGFQVSGGEPQSYGYGGSLTGN